MLTIKAEIKRSELKVDGTYNVKIRFTLDRKVKRLSTNLFVTQQDLTKSLKFKEDTSIKREIDRLVLYYREQCLKLQLDQNHYSLDEIIEFLNGEQEKQQTIDFIKFSREWIASATIKGAPNYTTAINALVRFVGKEELDINLITLDFLEQFKAFLIGERDARTKKLMQQGKRVTSNRTLSLYLVSIKKLFSEAKRKFNKKDKNLILIPNSPFEDFKIPKQREFEIKSKNSKLSVIDKLYVNGGLLCKKAVRLSARWSCIRGWSRPALPVFSCRNGGQLPCRSSLRCCR